MGDCFLLIGDRLNILPLNAKAFVMGYLLQLLYLAIDVLYFDESQNLLHTLLNMGLVDDFIDILFVFYLPEKYHYNVFQKK